MPMRCPGCQSLVNAPAHLHGATVRCRRCGEVFAVNSSDEVPVVQAVYEPPPERRFQERPIPAPPRVSRREPAERSRREEPRKSYGWLIAALALVFVTFVVGVVLIGGGVWWAMSNSDTPQGQVAVVGPPPRQGVPAAAAPATAPPRPQPQPQPGNDVQLSKEMLDRLKALMAYIKVEGGGERSSGSGFLIKADGDAGYLVTNAHVVLHERTEEAPGGLFPGFPGGLGPRMPFGPGGGFLPRGPFGPGGGFPGVPDLPDIPALPRLPRIFERPSVAVQGKVTVVLGSGMPGARSFPAEVIDADKDRDLAILKITGANLPPAIDLTDRADLRETASVFPVGFPFGTMLALGQNPEVTIGKATITSVRHDKDGRPGLVQLQGDINPGNSGGPVVDPDGRLVGVVFAKIRGTQIGLAIAPDRLEEMLRRSKATTRVNVVKAERDRSEVEFVVDVLDVFNSLAEVRLLYAPGTLAPRDAMPDDEGGYPPLAGAQTLALNAAGRRYSVRLTLTFAELRNGYLPVQVVYVGRDGRTMHGKPRNQAIPFEGRQAGPDPSAPNLPANGDGTHFQIINSEFKIRSRQGDVVIVVTGRVENRAAKVRSIKIEDGAETVNSQTIEGVPEKYRAAVRGLLEAKQFQDMVNPPAPKPPAGTLNISDKPPPVTDIFAAGPRVFVSELKEFGVVNGPWRVTKDGTTGGEPRREIQVSGNASPHGLGMHPPASPGFASIKFRPGKKATVFKATVAIDDSTNWCFSPAVFTVWGDGKKLFESKYIAHNHSRSQECSVDVSGVDVLELRVHTVNFNHGVHAVWVEPRLLQKADTPDK